MPRGSKPGERRGGRQRATPNKRTVLTDRILVVASCNPTATRHEFLLILARDQTLPADIRIAIARKSFPAVTSRSLERDTNKAFASLVPEPRSTEYSTNAELDRTDKSAAPTNRDAKRMGPKSFPALELLLSIAQDTTASAAERRKAGSEVAAYFLPKYAGGKKSRCRKFAPDECGFVVDPDLARELRDCKLRLASLPLAKKITPYNVAQRARKIQARIRAIHETLQCPCPSKYGHDMIERDRIRLESFRRRRGAQEILTFDEDIEEARRMARYDSFWLGPEIAARRRLAPLREKRRIYEQHRFDNGIYEKRRIWRTDHPPPLTRPRKKQDGPPPLTRAEKVSLRYLALLYPPPPPNGPDARSLAGHAFHRLYIPEDQPSEPSDLLLSDDLTIIKDQPTLPPDGAEVHREHSWLSRLRRSAALTIASHETRKS